jgi:DNA-binding FadR family transcriptional regulator
VSSDVPESTQQYVRENRDTLVEVLQHGDDEFARACAWTLLDAAGETPDLDELATERERLKTEEAT